MSDRYEGTPAVDRGLFGSKGWHRATRSHAIPDYPPWWDEDPRDSPSGEVEWIARKLRERESGWEESA